MLYDVWINLSILKKILLSILLISLNQTVEVHEFLQKKGGGKGCGNLYFFKYIELFKI